MILETPQLGLRPLIPDVRPTNAPFPPRYGRCRRHKKSMLACLRTPCLLSIPIRNSWTPPAQVSSMGLEREFWSFIAPQIHR